MLSLDNTYDRTEFFEFDQRLKKLFEAQELEYVVEPKIDGVAVSLTFKDGYLEQAVTEMEWKVISSPKISNILKNYQTNSGR